MHVAQAPGVQGRLMGCQGTLECKWDVRTLLAAQHKQTGEGLR